MSIEASTSTSMLLAYLEQVLVPALKRTKPDAILVMDNLRPHHATEVQDLLGLQSAATARVTLSGIEMVHMMRKQKAKYACDRKPSLSEQFHMLAA